MSVKSSKLVCVHTQGSFVSQSQHVREGQCEEGEGSQQIVWVDACRSRVKCGQVALATH